jgi:pyruvate,orthophosphate dikinase
MTVPTSTRHVHAFDAPDGMGIDRLGGKGSGLARMTSLGLPVPPGFTVDTGVCRHVLRDGGLPDDTWDEVLSALRDLEERTGRTFGSGPAPLLLSVRSGAAVSMPGMMDTVLDLGASRYLIDDLAAWADDDHFAYDARRRLLQMFGGVVLGITDDRFQRILKATRAEAGVDSDADLDAGHLARVCERFEAALAADDLVVPEDPLLQLRQAITAVFESWNTPRAIHYRKSNRIDDSLGTAATVQMMVFGDLGESSGTGVCFTRNPMTGERSPYGDYLPQAQGEDVVAGLRNTLSLDDLGIRHPEVHRQLTEIMDHLETTTTDMCDIEFTVEREQLFILQTRVGKRSAAAAVRIAVEMAEAGLISYEEAIRRVDPASLEQLGRPAIDRTHAGKPLLTGIGASPGAAQGTAVFDPDRAEAMAADGRTVILVRKETTPDDIHGMTAAAGILTSQGGKTSHAAVVARGMGRPAVTGAADLEIEGSIAVIGAIEIAEGDEITIDGSSGDVYQGLTPLVEPEPLPELDRLLEWADEIRTLGVRANADSGPDAARARAAGAEGIGLARTEHMFMGERLGIVQRIILTDDEAERDERLEELRATQTGDFEDLLREMDGLPVIVRLLDPPLHEFLPGSIEIGRDMLERVRAGEPTDDLELLDRQVRRWSEENPMLGLRGVRLGLVIADIYRLQIEAALEAVRRRASAGGDPRLEIMVPLVSTSEELVEMRRVVDAELESINRRHGADIHVQVGTMIELPRAALTADEIAAEADFFSFGTNDLTQMTFGLSRDDAEGAFLGHYLEHGILPKDPFRTLDVKGVGRLIQMAVGAGREAKPNLAIGVCGEHGGDPDSIDFFLSQGLDYVSVSPPRVPVARLAAAQAQLRAIERSASLS